MHEHEDGERACMSRRQFLLSGGAVVTLAAVPGGLALGAPLRALKADYPKVKIGRLSALKQGVPVVFAYPYPNVHNIL
ncbi:MAG: arsenate reductase (azurin) small subunit, partial [Rhodocyclales bacterium CG_4_9_14_3_um_filter_68_10]